MTREGRTHHEAGDYVVWREADDDDRYAIPRERFESMYEPLDPADDGGHRARSDEDLRA